MTGVLEGPIAKVKWATFHLDELAQALKPLAEEDPDFGLRRQRDDRTGEMVIYAINRRAFFTRYSVIVGEVIHQLRSSLDLFVWQAILANNEQPRPGVTGFPVCTDEADYAKRGLKMMKGMHEETVAAALAAQPFGNQFQTHPLFVLNELWNRDKHRLLNFARVQILAYKVIVKYPDGRMWQDLGNLSEGEDGDELYRFPIPTDIPAGVVPFEQMAFKMTFQDAGPATGEDVHVNLARLGDAVLRLMEQLAAAEPSTDGSLKFDWSFHSDIGVPQQ